VNGGLGGYNRPKGSGASSFLVFSPAVVVAHGWARTLDVRFRCESWLWGHWWWDWIQDQVCRCCRRWFRVEGERNHTGILRVSPALVDPVWS